MVLRACALVLGVLLAAASSAETIYKYRQADGKMIYSNRPISGIELVETFEYTFPKPAVPDPKAEKRAAEAEQRIKKHLSGRRGRAAPEYVARMQALEAAVHAARVRLDVALSRYNKLR